MVKEWNFKSMTTGSLGTRPLHTEEKEGLVNYTAYINSLWDMTSLQASYAIIEGVDWVQLCLCSISYCKTLQTLSLPVKILVSKRPFDSTLESVSVTLADNLNS